MLAQRRRRWANINPALVQCLVSTGKLLLVSQSCLETDWSNCDGGHLALRQMAECQGRIIAGAFTRCLWAHPARNFAAKDGCHNQIFLIELDRAGALDLAYYHAGGCTRNYQATGWASDQRSPSEIGHFVLLGPRSDRLCSTGRAGQATLSPVN